MAKAKIRDPETMRLIEKIQRAEDKALAERRRRLYNAVSRALLHLNDGEMNAIEQVAWTAIGRSTAG